MSPNRNSPLPAQTQVQNNHSDTPAQMPRRVTPHDSFTSRFLSLFNNEERRISERRSRTRVASPPLRAYLGIFGSSEPYPVGNISSSGFYLVTKDHWLRGTNMPLRLERTDKSGYAALHCVAVPTRVVRAGEDGVGFSFVLQDAPATPKPKRSSFAETEGVWLGARWADRHAIEELVAELETAQADHR